jgi:hypothetical protein
LYLAIKTKNQTSKCCIRKSQKLRSQKLDQISSTTQLEERLEESASARILEGCH